MSDEAKRLARALSAVVDGDLSVEEAAKHFRAPYKALTERVRAWRTEHAASKRPTPIAEQRLYNPRPTLPAKHQQLEVGTKVHVRTTDGLVTTAVVTRSPWQHLGGWFVRVDSHRSPIAAWRVTRLEDE